MTTATRNPLSRAARVTLALTGALALAAVVVSVRAGAGPVLAPDLPGPAVAGGLVTMFFLTEHLLLNVEFRRQTHSLTLAGVPIFLTVLLAPAHTGAAVRVAGAVGVLLLQRMSWDKVAFNLAAYAFEMSVDSALARALGGAGEHLSVRRFLVVLAVVAVVDQFTSGVVLLVIRLHNGPLTPREVLEVSVPAALVTTMSACFAATGVLLVDDSHVLGVLLVVAVAVVIATAYRVYAATARRHQSLELVHEFVAQGLGAENVTGLAGQLLERVRSLMRAGVAELTVTDPAVLDVAHPGDAVAAATTAAQQLRLTVGEGGALVVTREPVPGDDWVASRAREGNQPVVLARNAKDRAIRHWLARHGARDAVAVPVTGTTGASTLLTVYDRLGETATFDGDDVALLQTLAGHLAVALRSARLVERLSYGATHDPLTGLANRSELADRIDAALSGGDRDAAVLMLDLDGFKEVNDTLGHDAGDRLLVAVADRLRAGAPADATVARLGGDEFAVLLPHAGTAERPVVALAQAVAAALAQPIELDEARVDTAASIGVALAAAEAGPADRAALLSHADTAMYAAKASEVAVCVYDVEMDSRRIERLELLADLRASLIHHPEQFVVHYQPKIELAGDQALTSVEALVRWQHPVRGLVGPDRFIPLAEQTGLIEDLTPLVLDAALRECAQWAARGHEVSVAVNLSARTIENELLPARVAAALRRHAVPAHLVILEITESSVMGDPDHTVPILHQLKKIGLSLSLDDFGTGYSSLSYLQRLPVDEVKIDRSFVMGLSSPDPHPSRALIQSITALGTNLGLRIVAEGVEDEDRLRELQELGCHVAQGYHISRPLPAAAVHAWIDDRSGSLDLDAPGLLARGA